MTFPEITMLRQSAMFVQRLMAAARRLGDSQYRFRRRVNWSHRYHSDFYQQEALHFTSGVDDYIAGKCLSEPRIDDVFSQKLRWKQVLVSLMKIHAHWLFLLMGHLFFNRQSTQRISVYRKAYVDDIELVFDTEQPFVIRAVYPFPVSIRRQIRYLCYLRQKKYLWRFTGNPYSVTDAIQFLIHRDLRSLQRLESRSQIRSAFRVAAMGVKCVQLSDEFDIGSLDFTRTLARLDIFVVNSAHGVGKYLPVHAYQEFQVLTSRQQQYYVSTRPCRHSMRMLNGKAPQVQSKRTSKSNSDDAEINFVFLSGQSSRGVGETYLSSNEARAVKRLADEFSAAKRVRLLYRPHPNNHNPIPPDGFQQLSSLEDVNGRSNTIFASFSSTCQIDPAFRGRKILIRGELMYPEVWFDDTEEMLDLDRLIEELWRHEAAGGTDHRARHAAITD
jgi:hypothetical protein